MYHAYNLMTVSSDNQVSISRLPETGRPSLGRNVNAKEALSVLDGLKSSALFREDQYSYILYPNKDLPRFDEE
jgi:hypothetical protein